MCRKSFRKLLKSLIALAHGVKFEINFLGFFSHISSAKLDSKAGANQIPLQVVLEIHHSYVPDNPFYVKTCFTSRKFCYSLGEWPYLKKLFRFSIMRMFFPYFFESKRFYIVGVAIKASYGITHMRLD